MFLTNKIIRALEYEGEETRSGQWSQHVVWDDVPGFGLRLYPSGVKSFILRYVTARGTQRLHTIGQFGEGKDKFSAARARERAEELRAIVRDGGDPRGERQEARDGLTFDDLAEEYVEKYAKQRKKTWAQDEDRIERHLSTRWGSWHPAEISRADVAKMHREIAEGIGTYRKKTKKGKRVKSRGGKTEANRTLALTSKLFNWAIKQGFLDGDNPANGVDKYTEKKRDRWVLHDEMPHLLDALDEYGEPFVSGLFWFILYTGARKSEALGLQWRDVHLGRNEVTFRDTKNNTDHVVPLSGPASTLLAELPQVDGNPHVFVGRVDGQSLQSVRKSWDAICKRAGELAKKKKTPIDLTDVTIHDLRRTVGAWLATSGYSELLIGRVLNHSVRSVTGIYARVGDDAVRNALETHARQLANVRSDGDGKVVELQEAR